MHIGLDIGGTKTHLRAVDSSGEVVVDVRVASSTWVADDVLASPVSMRALGALLSDSSVDPTSPLAVGASGCDTDPQINELAAAIQTIHQGPVLVINDAYLVGPAAGVSAFVGLIAGTGSKVVGRTLAGTSVTSGGHGFMLADPGSAPGLVRDAVVRVMRNLDRTGEIDSLAVLLMNAYGVNEIALLPHRFTAIASSPNWAKSAPLIFAAADAGSPVAVETIHAAAAQLADHVTDVLDRGAIADAIICSGGVISAQTRLLDQLVEELTTRGIRMPLRVLEDDPVAGAVALARAMQ